MILIDKEQKVIKLVGDKSTLVEEISVAMMALLDNMSQTGKSLAMKTYLELAEGLAKSASMLHIEYGVDVNIAIDEQLRKLAKELSEEKSKAKKRDVKINVKIKKEDD